MEWFLEKEVEVEGTHHLKCCCEFQTILANWIAGNSEVALKVFYGVKKRC